MASNNTASIAQARKLVEQLKMEANIDRIKVSRCFGGLQSDGRRALTRSSLRLRRFQKRRQT